MVLLFWLTSFQRCVYIYIYIYIYICVCVFIVYQSSTSHLLLVLKRSGWLVRDMVSTVVVCKLSRFPRFFQCMFVFMAGIFKEWLRMKNDNFIKACNLMILSWKPRTLFTRNKLWKYVYMPCSNTGFVICRIIYRLFQKLLTYAWDS